MDNIFPIYSLTNNSFTDGILFKIHPFCSQRLKSKKCLDYFQSLMTAHSNTIQTCPYGYSVYFQGEGAKIICSLQVKNHFDKSKLKKRQSSVFSPVITSQTLIEYLAVQDTMYQGLNSFKDSLHDVRKLNANIVSIVESLQSDMIETNKDYWDIKRIEGTCGLIRTNLDIFDATANPGFIKLENKQHVHVYKLFDKVQKCLKYMFEKKHISVNITGEFDSKIKLSSSFSSVPFILLENAVKYSYDKGQVNIIFDNQDNKLEISVNCDKSLRVLPHEYDLILLRGYRGEHARKLKGIGQGKGMHFVKKVCDANNIDISIHSNQEDIEFHANREYSTFKITLSFHL